MKGQEESKEGQEKEDVEWQSKGRGCSRRSRGGEGQKGEELEWHGGGGKKKKEWRTIDKEGGGSGASKGL